jgi:hypothetical protein
MFNIEDIKKEGFYQTVDIKGVEYKGCRDCDKRWQAIKPYVNKNSVVMDIGSNYGYFSHKIAKLHPDCLVWSIESDSKRAEIQKMVLTENDIKNIVLSEYELKLNDFVQLARGAEGIDTILALSVIHYFPPEDLPHIIWLMSMIAPNLIIEPPSVEESQVAEKDNVNKMGLIENYLNLFYESVDKIGESPSPKDKTIMRPIYRAENKSLFRKGVVGYIGGEMGRSHNISFNNGWKLDKKRKWQVGLNLVNLIHFNLIYPHRDRLIARAGERYFDILKTKFAPTDVRPWNCLVTPFDVEVIDYKERTGVYENWEKYQKDVANWSPEDFADRIKENLLWLKLG